MNQRSVSVSRLFNLLFTESKLSLIGLILTLFAAVILYPLISLQVSNFQTNFGLHDYSVLKNNAEEFEADIIQVEYLNNITINGQHPIKTTYQFNYHGRERVDEFVSMDWYKAQEFESNKRIIIVANDDISMVKGMEPPGFAFKLFYIFYIFPAIVFVVGLALLLAGFIKALKVYTIYQKGIVRDGIAELFIPAKKNIVVSYSYEGSAGQKIGGKSTFKSSEILNKIKMKDPIKVLVLPENELKSVMVPPNNEWGI